MPASRTPQEIQKHINEMQSLYREWLSLLPKLEAAQEDWQRAAGLMRQLSDFYFNGPYLQYREAIENGVKIDTRTRGEYSIMSEDALWDAFHDQQTLAWQRLRSALAVLDKENDESGQTR